MDVQSAAKQPFNLKILKTDKDGKPELAAPFVAMFNPEQLAITESVKLISPVAPGNQGTDPKPICINPREFSLEFTLDGTGVSTNGVKIPVTAQVSLFRSVTTTFVGDEHRPAYLMVQYGPFICACTLKSSTVTYTLFDMFGVPIRAKITASFVERTQAALGKILSRLSSPDLTRSIVVKEGDLLPLLTYQTYKNQDYYLQVARINKLKNFRRLKAGTTLVFPPISKKAQTR